METGEVVITSPLSLTLDAAKRLCDGMALVMSGFEPKRPPYWSEETEHECALRIWKNRERIMP